MTERSFNEMIAYFNRRVAGMDINPDYKMELLGMVTALGFKHEKSAPHWIPCSERLPKIEREGQRRGWYLTTNEYGVVCETQYEFYHDFLKTGWQSDIRIVAWMPKPEAYKGVKE